MTWPYLVRAHAKKRHNFCMAQDETFDHLFTCQQLGAVVPNIMQGVALSSFSSLDLNVIDSLGKFLQKYQQYREILV